MKNKYKDGILKTLAISTLALTTVDCSHHHLVACYGLHTINKKPYVVMDEGLCTKLAGGISKPLPPNAVIPEINDNDYVMCYGVAAAGKNDCGTKTTACSGSISTPKDPSAWVAALSGVCKEIGGKEKNIKEDQNNLQSP